MKKLTLLILVLAAMMLVGCASSKTVSIDPITGKKTIKTKSDASVFSNAQAAAWKEYYSSLKNPPVIAVIKQKNGDVITINSQVPPPEPVIRQYEDQWAKTANRFVDGAFGLGEKGVITYGVVKALDSMQGTNINNNGSGSVHVDRSKAVETQVIKADDGGVLSQGSHNPLANADPTIVRPEVVNPEVVVVDPTVVDPKIVDPKVVVVPPADPPTPEE